MAGLDWPVPDYSTLCGWQRAGSTAYDQKMLERALFFYIAARAAPGAQVPNSFGFMEKPVAA